MSTHNSETLNKLIQLAKKSVQLYAGIYARAHIRFIHSCI